MRPERIIVALAMLWYLITAYTSVGYYHADEHFQIIEFAGVLTGNTRGDALPWEFREQIRPTLQPVICAAIFQVCSLVNIDEPHMQALILRLITAFLSVFLIWKFCLACRPWIQAKYWLSFLVLSYFLWFLPMIMVRYSSETWSSLALLACLIIVIRGGKSRSDYLLLGVFSGIAFLFRFQIAIALIGLIVWMLLIRKDAIKRIIQVLLVSLGIVSLGSLLDSWFYGQPVLTFYNYLYANLIQGKAADFGTSAWHDYFVQIYHGAFPALALLLFGALGIMAFKNYRHVSLWLIVPFFIVHALIGHKELRFLFPLAPLLPLILILATQELPDRIQAFLVSKGGSVIVTLILLVNLLGMGIASLSAPGEGRIRITKHISDLDLSHATLIHFQDFSPYRHWGLPCTHYFNEAIVERKFRLMEDYSPDTVGTENVLLVIREAQNEEAQIKAFIDYHHMEKICSASPDYIKAAWKFFGYKRSFNLELYQNRKD